VHVVVQDLQVVEPGGGGGAGGLGDDAAGGVGVFALRDVARDREQAADVVDGEALDDDTGQLAVVPTGGRRVGCSSRHIGLYVT
jgi:hypothetical protein